MKEEFVRYVEELPMWRWRLASHNAERRGRGEAPRTMNQFLEFLDGEFARDFKKYNAERTVRGRKPVTEEKFRDMIWGAYAKARRASSRRSDKPH
jgi:hypothetical protein